MTDATLQTQSPAASGSPPRWSLIGMGLLVLATIAVAGLARQTGIGATGIPESPTVAQVDLRFEDKADGSVVIHDGAGALLATLAVSQDGFIRGAMRSLTRQRQIVGVGQEQPFRLERRENGRLSLSDPATGGRIELDAFGPSNSAAFARFLPARQTRP
jgi:putative photosynthetic complex assembly protein